jgi:hypothetical protein
LTHADVLKQYQARLAELESTVARTRVRSRISGILLLVVVGLLVTTALSAVRRRAAIWWPVLDVGLIVVTARSYSNNRHLRDRTWRLWQMYSRSLERVGGNWAGRGDSGEEFGGHLDPEHLYAGDLNIFGEGSLFELLCTGRTANGKRGLANYLLTLPALDEAHARQEAVRELRDRTDLREKIAVLGAFDAQQSKWETFAAWLDAPPFAFGRWLQAAILATSAAAAGLIVAGMTGLLPWPEVGRSILPIGLFHAAVGLAFRTRVNRMSESLRLISVETQVLREGLRVLEDMPFQAAKLRELKERARGGSEEVRKLERLLNALDERNKEWFYFVSLILMAGTQLSMAVESWRTRNRDALRSWLDAWAEFEALNALANYAYENPENVWPEIGGGASFEAVALGHPLLPDASCVRNDVALHGDTRFYLLSGSNMAGKSTLLRAIGLNTVLAYAGAPVRAQALRLSRLSVCASLSVVDSLLNGKSKFLAEMDRLRQSLTAALAADPKAAPVLFLVDEILSGTNSQDRRIAAEAVVRTLIERGAIGVLSTHDLALSEIAELPELHGANVHMGSRSGGGPMDFDYLLKPGVTKEANALAIARMAGVPV